MEERLLQLGDWLRPNGEAIYGTHARSVTRQWSQGKVPQLEVKEYMSEYPISALIDTPPAGNARIDAFFTANKDAVYAVMPRRPVGDIVLNGIEGQPKVTLLEGGQPLESTRQGANLRVRVPAQLAANLPARQAYVLKLQGAR
jgi:alpha-L-fucosidase